MIFKFAGYTIDIDAEKTQEYYAPHDYDYYNCGCQGCRNFMKAADTEISDEEKEFFTSLGLDIRKVHELGYCPISKEKHDLIYSGLYHVCGRLIESQEGPYVPGNSCVYFRETPSFPVKDFPQPYIELDVNMVLPFVLDEENQIS